MAEETASSNSADSASPKRRALDFAWARLARRDHTVFELSEKMRRAGYVDDDVRRTVDYLKSLGYLNDARFARRFAENACEVRRWGPLRIEQRLRSLGLTDAQIRAGLEKAFPQGEDHAAEDVLGRYLRSRRHRRKRAAPREEQARAYRYLMSRGFSPDVAHRLVTSSVFEDTEQTEEP